MHIRVLDLFYKRLAIFNAYLKTTTVFDGVVIQSALTRIAKIGLNIEVDSKGENTGRNNSGFIRWMIIW